MDGTPPEDQNQDLQQEALTGESGDVKSGLGDDNQENSKEHEERQNEDLSAASVRNVDNEDNQSENVKIEEDTNGDGVVEEQKEEANKALGEEEGDIQSEIPEGTEVKDSPLVDGSEHSLKTDSEPQEDRNQPENIEEEPKEQVNETVAVEEERNVEESTAVVKEIDGDTNEMSPEDNSASQPEPEDAPQSAEVSMTAEHVDDKVQEEGGESDVKGEGEDKSSDEVKEQPVVEQKTDGDQSTEEGITGDTRDPDVATNESEKADAHVNVEEEGEKSDLQDRSSLDIAETSGADSNDSRVNSVPSLPDDTHLTDHQTQLELDEQIRQMEIEQQQQQLQPQQVDEFPSESTDTTASETTLQVEEVPKVVEEPKISTEQGSETFTEPHAIQIEETLEGGKDGSLENKDSELEDNQGKEDEAELHRLEETADNTGETCPDESEVSHVTSETPARIDDDGLLQETTYSTTIADDSAIQPEEPVIEQSEDAVSKDDTPILPSEEEVPRDISDEKTLDVPDEAHDVIQLSETDVLESSTPGTEESIPKPADDQQRPLADSEQVEETTTDADIKVAQLPTPEEAESEITPIAASEQHAAAPPDVVEDIGNLSRDENVEVKDDGNQVPTPEKAESEITPTAVSEQYAAAPPDVVEDTSKDERVEVKDTDKQESSVVTDIKVAQLPTPTEAESEITPIVETEHYAATSPDVTEDIGAHSKEEDVEVKDTGNQESSIATDVADDLLSDKSTEVAEEPLKESSKENKESIPREQVEDEEEEEILNEPSPDTTSMNTPLLGESPTKQIHKEEPKHEGREDSPAVIPTTTDFAEPEASESDEKSPLVPKSQDEGKKSEYGTRGEEESNKQPPSGLFARIRTLVHAYCNIL
ncbi:uncharacterized protein [Amphiura filiformis]|uniref:uncharacterized protein n=1 Tax=Amphiura filiformis TaxID=82378 RepID=UPI003B21341A